MSGRGHAAPVVDPWHSRDARIEIPVRRGPRSSRSRPPTRTRASSRISRPRSAASARIGSAARTPSAQARTIAALYRSASSAPTRFPNDRAGSRRRARKARRRGDVGRRRTAGQASAGSPRPSKLHVSSKACAFMREQEPFRCCSPSTWPSSCIATQTLSAVGRPVMLGLIMTVARPSRGRPIVEDSARQLVPHVDAGEGRRRRTRRRLRAVGCAAQRDVRPERFQRRAAASTAAEEPEASK